MEQISRDQDASGAWRRPWSRRLAVGPLRLELPQPAVGASENFRGAALVAAVLGDGTAGNRPFHVIQVWSGNRCAPVFSGAHPIRRD